MWAVLTYRQEWDEQEFFATGEDEIAEVLAYTESLGLDVGGGDALDFGCGLGRLTRALSDRFEQVVGIDISSAMVARAEELNGDRRGCRFVVNKHPDLRDFDSESFDFVYSNITLQHMPWEAASGYLRDFVRVLRPHGVLVFQLPAGVREEHRESGGVAGLARRARSALGVAVRLGRRHMEMHCTPRDQVEDALRDAGATITDVKADDRAGRHWYGFRYTATKPATA
jgi:SAM-dependent methyltransferase